jgi:single-strand DNA-binding protein
MSGTYNHVTLLGRLGRTPELRYTQSGTPVANMSLATNEVYKDRDGNQQQKTDWHKVNVWGSQGENAAKYLEKGRLVLVEGKIQTSKWQDNQGNNRTSVEIRASRVVFLPSGQGGGGQAEGEGVGSEEPGPAFPSEPGGMDNAPF